VHVTRTAVAASPGAAALGGTAPSTEARKALR
jgi:hypothetical protein